MIMMSLHLNALQRLASDFLASYIFLAVGRVGSSTDLIAQRVEYVLESEERSHLMELLHAQRENDVNGKVIVTSVVCILLVKFTNIQKLCCTGTVVYLRVGRFVVLSHSIKDFFCCFCSKV